MCDIISVRNAYESWHLSPVKLFLQWQTAFSDSIRQIPSLRQKFAHKLIWHRLPSNPEKGVQMLILQMGISKMGILNRDLEPYNHAPHTPKRDSRSFKINLFEISIFEIRDTHFLDSRYPFPRFENAVFEITDFYHELIIKSNEEEREILILICIFFRKVKKKSRNHDKTFSGICSCFWMNSWTFDDWSMSWKAVNQQFSLKK